MPLLFLTQNQIVKIITRSGANWNSCKSIAITHENYDRKSMVADFGYQICLTDCKRREIIIIKWVSQSNT
jgi:hypothetical protein